MTQSSATTQKQAEYRRSVFCRLPRRKKAPLFILRPKDGSRWTEPTGVAAGKPSDLTEGCGADVGL